MKKQNRIHTFALSMLMTGLSVIPVWAFSGQINSGVLETVTCINHDTGQAAPGTVSATGFDCSALASQPGDFIGVVLSGTTGDGPPPPPTSCEQREMEPNNDINQAQDLGMLQGDCQSISVTGQTTVGIGSDPNNNPTPGADIDSYKIDVSGASQPMFNVSGSNGGWFFVAVDLDTQQALNVECSDAGCAILGQPSRVALQLVTEQATTYTLHVSDGGTGLSSLTRSTNGGQQLDRVP